MNKNSKRPLSGRSRGKNNRNNNASNNIQSGAVTSCPFVVDSFLVDQATSGNGGFTSQASAASKSSANNFFVDPYNLGGMPYHIASLFMQYRFLWVKIDYIPYSTASGVLTTTSGQTSAPVYGSRNFAWGFQADPYAISSTYTSIVIGGGQESNTSRRSSIIMRGGTLSAWRYTTTTAASPTYIDLRMVAPAVVNFAYQQASTTLATTYGNIKISGVMQVRYQIDNAAPIGLSLQSTENIRPQSADEQKSNKKPDNQSVGARGWF